MRSGKPAEALRFERISSQRERPVAMPSGQEDAIPEETEEVSLESRIPILHCSPV